MIKLTSIFLLVAACAYADTDSWQPSIRSFQYARIEEKAGASKKAISLTGEQPTDLVALVVDLKANEVIKFPQENWTVALIEGEPSLESKQLGVLKSACFEFQYKSKRIDELGWKVYCIFAGAQQGIYIAAPKGTQLEKGEVITVIFAYEVPASSTLDQLKQDGFTFVASGYRAVRLSFPAIKSAMEMQGNKK